MCIAYHHVRSLVFDQTIHVLANYSSDTSASEFSSIHFSSTIYSIILGLQTRGKFNKASALGRSLYWFQALHIMNIDRYQSTSARRALALLNSPQLPYVFTWNVKCSAQRNYLQVFRVVVNTFSQNICANRKLRELLHNSDHEHSIRLARRKPQMGD